MPPQAPLPADVADAIAGAGTRLGAFGVPAFFAEVASTNDIAMTLAADGAPHGTSVLADLQRAGRGRRGRQWYSPPGSGVYLSIVVRPPDDAAALPLITLAAGVAAATAVREASALPVELKWPNDLVVGRPWRKLGGVLSEAVGGSAVQAVVVGIGINVLAPAFPRELADRATSIETELGRDAERGRVVAEILCAFNAVWPHVQAGPAGRAWICDEWRRLGRAGLGGAPVRWDDHGEPRRGTAIDLDATGTLLVESSRGRERLVAGEVFWEQLSRV